MNALAVLSSLLFNLVLVVGMVFLVSLVAPRTVRWPRPVVRALLGCLFGAAAIVGMLVPVPISIGIVLDSRVPLVSLAGLLGGGWGALAATVLAGAYRMVLGGSGWVAGVGAIVTAAAIGLLVRRFARGNPWNLRWFAFVLLGLVLAASGLGWVFTLAPEQAQALFERLWLPVLLFYPVATWSVGSLFVYQRRRDASEAALAASRQQVFEEKEKLAVTLASLGDGVVATDLEERISLLNAAAEALTGWSADVIGQNLGDLLPGVGEGGPVRLRRPDGSSVEVAVVRRPWRNRDGSQLGSVIVLRDMSVQYRAHLALDRANRLEELGVRAGGLVHDLNNVLGVLLGSLDLARLKIQQGEPATALLPELDRALVAHQRGQALTRQILSFAKGEAPPRRELDLGSVIRRGLQSCLDRTAVRVEVDLPDAMPCLGVEEQLFQVVENLAVNARDAQAGRGYLRVSALADPGVWKVLFEDGGPGFTADAALRAFEPFHTTKTKGTGLGLASSWSLVHDHGGSLEVLAPRSGHGAQIVLTLPKER